MANTPDEQLYTFTVDAIRRSIERLGSRRSHEQFPGYLALLKEGGAEGPIAADASTVSAFWRTYFKVEGLSKDDPFVQPFRSRGSGATTQNKNLSGSYSKRSIRPGLPFSHVVEMVPSQETRSGVTYRLKPDHAEAVLTHMLVGHPVPAVALSAFLFRDHPLSLGSDQPKDVIGALRSWLRIPPGSANGDSVFDTVFYDDSADYSPADFETYGGA